MLVARNRPAILHVERWSKGKDHRLQDGGRQGQPGHLPAGWRPTEDLHPDRRETAAAHKLCDRGERPDDGNVGAQASAMTSAPPETDLGNGGQCLPQCLPYELRATDVPEIMVSEKEMLPD